MKPDTLDCASEAPHLGKGIMEPGPAAELTPLFLNLDEDPGEELIGILRYARCEPMLFVFKMIGNSWYLLHHESIFVHNEEPELLVANTPSAHKTFYVRFLQDRGSGIYRDSYRFYKLIGNKVHGCLELTNRASIYGWGLYLNQKVDLRLQFNSTYEDAIAASYRYSFFPGAVFDHEMSWAAHPEIPFVQGSDLAYYKWDASTLTYQLIAPALDEPTNLNKAKIATFGNFGNDSLFVRAFAYEIDETLREGTPAAKRLLASYLRFVKQKQRPPVHFGELEEKQHVKGTKFYGPKPN
ncbi:hypothetical protein GCM10022409_00910 [Hymenobacter glaciei]|uniref:Uncharacterized protein n=1 Tax=Hymenobacter glaciei TaxID=877209 RepID=A0ABP7T513_9BACT